MARLKFDVKGVDPGGDFETPKPGAYKCKIDVIEQKESAAGNPMLEVQYVIIDKGDFKGARLWDYVVLTENQLWKYRRFLEAVGAVTGGKEKGEIDTDKLIGKKVLVRVTNETSDEWGTKARVGSVASLNGSAAVEEDDDDEDLDDEELEDEELDDEEEEELTYDDVMGMTKVELRDLVKENELGIRITKQSKLNDLRERVADKMVDEEMIEPADAEDEEDEEAEVEEVEDYAELSVGDLRNECKERGLSTKGAKSALVKRLEKDDEEDDPFSA